MMPDHSPLDLPQSEITARKVDLSRRRFMGAAVAAVGASGTATAAVAHPTEPAVHDPVVGAAAYDFNLDSTPSIPGHDWND